MKIFDKSWGNLRNAWTKISTRQGGEILDAQNFEDTTVIEEVNKYIRNNYSPQDLTNREAGWRRVATLPMSVYLQLQKEGIANDPKAFRKWLNDPDNRAWTLGSKL